MVLGDDLVFVWHIDHAVVARDDQPHVIGRARKPFHIRSMRTRWSRQADDRHAVDMAAVIKFALVGIDQAAATSSGGRGHEGYTLILVGFVSESDEGRTAAQPR